MSHRFADVGSRSAVVSGGGPVFSRRGEWRTVVREGPVETVTSDSKTFYVGTVGSETPLCRVQGRTRTRTVVYYVRVQHGCLYKRGHPCYVCTSVAMCVSYRDVQTFTPVYGRTIRTYPPFESTHVSTNISLVRVRTVSIQENVRTCTHR